MPRARIRGELRGLRRSVGVERVRSLASSPVSTLAGGGWKRAATRGLKILVSVPLGEGWGTEEALLLARRPRLSSAVASSVSMAR